jgi:hypothetical protein
MLVYLVGGDVRNEGNVYIFNPSTNVFGPVCDKLWDLDDVSIFLLLSKLLFITFF